MRSDSGRGRKKRGSSLEDDVAGGNPARRGGRAGGPGGPVRAPVAEVLVLVHLEVRDLERRAARQLQVPGHRNLGIENVRQNFIRSSNASPLFFPALHHHALRRNAVHCDKKAAKNCGKILRQTPVNMKLNLSLKAAN